MHAQAAATVAVAAAHLNSALVKRSWRRKREFKNRKEEEEEEEEEE